MIDSLNDGILEFQGIIAARGAMCVKKFSQPHQRCEADASAVVIFQPRTGLLVDHPAEKDAVGSIGQRDNLVLGIKSTYVSQNPHLASI